MKKMFFDTETGGINPKVHSLLTAFFAICDDDFNVVDELYLQLKPSDPSKLNVTQEALNINKININAHLRDPKTVTYEEGGEILWNFLLKHSGKGRKRDLISAGHNIEFDKQMIYNNLMSQEKWDELVHYRTLDTSVACTFLKDVGYFPSDVGSLESLVDLFKIPKGEVHDARGDVLMNIAVYKEMVRIMSVNKTNTATTSSSSLLQIIER